MKLACLAVLLVALPVGFARAAEQIVRTCDFEVKARCVSGEARVTLADGVVQRLELDVFWCGPPKRPGYTCMIDASRGDDESKWSDEAGVTVIVNTVPFNADRPDRVKVTVGKDVSIDMDEAQSLGRCGAGAELPRGIVVPAQGKVCRVWLSAP